MKRKHIVIIGIWLLVVGTVSIYANPYFSKIKNRVDASEEFIKKNIDLFEYNHLSIIIDSSDFLLPDGRNGLYYFSYQCNRYVKINTNVRNLNVYYNRNTGRGYVKFSSDFEKEGRKNMLASVQNILWNVILLEEEFRRAKTNILKKGEMI